VIEAAVARLRELTDPTDAAIGPGAGACCYEAGPEVHAAFARYNASRGALLDLRAVATAKLEAIGVACTGNVDVCTICAPVGQLFSHRREGPQTGRQAGLGLATLSVARVRGNLAEVRAEIAAAARVAGAIQERSKSSRRSSTWRHPSSKFSPMPAWRSSAENRAQALVEKVAVTAGRLRWHFIGALQSRKVKVIAPHVELIHSVASESALHESAVTPARASRSWSK